ncbi:MAG: hypothetical protein ABW061_16360, partial [Polyangiaceae bacterium]
MDCSQIRDAFLRGELLSEAEVQAHLAACPECTALFERDAELGRALAAESAPVSAFPEAVFAEVEARVALETGPRAWLRSRPTQLRLLLVALCVVLLVALGGGLLQRPDLAQYPIARMVILLGAYFLAVLLAVGKELSLGVRGGKFGDYVVLASFGLALPFLAAFVPATEASRHSAPEGALGCFLYGALFTMPLSVLLWAVDRDDRPSLRTVCLSAAALGLSANLLLELHCPSGHPIHLVLGHATLGL